MNLIDNQMKKALQERRRGRFTGFYTDKRGAHKKKGMISDKQNIMWFAEYVGQNPSKVLDELRSQFCSERLNGRSLSNSTFIRLLKHVGYTNRLVPHIPPAKNDASCKLYRFDFVRKTIENFAKGTISSLSMKQTFLFTL